MPLRGAVQPQGRARTGPLQYAAREDSAASGPKAQESAGVDTLAVARTHDGKPWEDTGITKLDDLNLRGNQHSTSSGRTMIPCGTVLHPHCLGGSRPTEMGQADTELS
ncbi:hypothetical protein NDU88_003291 [Pleurodeles waltl]|uniref:Uncharacterized protein n=1 Tax=Pleurodeles waltl TaxID=8319 RepID=A0AAV7MU64_PLEWA|nr:hypothetical protein NDU88_003291 [Pleurodeles waltl]